MVARAVATAALLAAPAAAAAVHVVADPWAHGGALGLLVPGHGVTVTRAAALAELAKQRPPAGVEVYIALPPPGRTHNIRRYPIAVVGPATRACSPRRDPGSRPRLDPRPRPALLAGRREPAAPPCNGSTGGSTRPTTRETAGSSS